MRIWRGSGLFVVGIAVGALGLQALRPGIVTTSEAQRRVLAMLDRPPLATSAGDTPIVTASRRILPTVVSIDTVGRVRQQEKSGKPVFQEQQKQQEQQQEQRDQQEQEVRGKGSGVVLSPDGYIVTNDHVIEGATRIRVTFTDGDWRFARLIGRDQDRDLAVLRVERQQLAYAEMGDSDRLQVGETVLAVGNPMGLGASVTTGIVSGLNRHNLQVDSAHNLDGAIQTDAAINRGNSGGALTNIHGQLIGINTAILSAEQNGGSIGLGFALPINAVRSVVRRLIASSNAPSTPHKAWLGISLSPLSPESRQALGTLADTRSDSTSDSTFRSPSDSGSDFKGSDFKADSTDLKSQGIRVDRVLPETPASVAGLEPGDILLRFDAPPLRDPHDVATLLTRHKAGDHSTLHIFRPREQREMEIPIEIQDRP